MSDIPLHIDCLEESLGNLRSLLADPRFKPQLDNDALYALLAEKGLAEEERSLDEWREMASKPQRGELLAEDVENELAALRNQLRKQLAGHVGPPTEPPPPPADAEVRRLDTVAPRTTCWLWPGRVALGRLTLVAGEPGAGTSLLLMDLASRVSRGRAFPPARSHYAADPDSDAGPDEIGRVQRVPVAPGAGDECDDHGANAEPEAAGVVLIMRQSMEDIVVQRLAVLGADLTRFHALGEVVDRKKEKRTMRPFRAYSDLEHLESLLARTPGVKLVVLDPMELALDERGQSISYGDRQTIRNLGELARRWGVAIVAAARLPDKPGANDLRRWLDKLAGVEELGALFAVVRDRRRPCRRYLAAVKNTLAEMEDALAFETPGGWVVWRRGSVSSAVVWATPSRLDQEDAARWLRQELGSRQVAAKELRAAADEAGIPWHVVYRAKGIAGADCGRVGSGAGSYFVWSLFDLVEDEETEWNGERSVEPTRFAGAPVRSAVRTEPTDPPGNEIGNSQERAKSSIENTKTGERSAEPTRFAGAPMSSAERTEPTDPPGNEIGNSPERAKSSIENTKTGQEDDGPRAADGGLPSEPPSGFAATPFRSVEPSVPGGNAGSARRREGRWHAELGNETSAIQNEFSDPAAVTERPRPCEEPLDQLDERSLVQKGASDQTDDQRVWIRYGESQPVLVSNMESDRLWAMLTNEHQGPELQHEIERVLRERCDPRLKDEGFGERGR